MKRILTWLTILLLASTAVAAQPDIFVYIGTYANQQTPSIHCYSLNLTTGAMTPLATVGQIANPSYLAVHPDKPLLLAVSEVAEFGGQRGGGVGSFTLDEKSGEMKLHSTQSSGGAGPCFVSLDPAGKYAMVANWSGGSIACLPIDDTGSLRPPSAFMQFTGNAQPHAHAISLDPTGRYALATDMGCDRLNVFEFDVAKGGLTPRESSSITLAPKTGPRHFAFSHDGRYLFVLNELACTIDTFAWDAKLGTLTRVDTISSLPVNYSQRRWGAAHIQLHPSGKWLYVSNRATDDIAIFSLDAQTGKLTNLGCEPTRGKMPRHFAIEPSGRWLLAANQNSANVQVFRIDDQTGLLQAVGDPVPLANPACIVFRPRD